MRAICIHGLGPKTKGPLVIGPYWENWGLALDVERIFNFDIVFEIHDPKVWREKGAPPPPEDLMRQLENPLYMRNEFYGVDDFPRAVEYPMEMVRDETGIEPACSVGFMFALAITKDPLIIKFTGCDLDQPEHAYQIPCLAYLKGLAFGKGIDVEGLDHITKFEPYGDKIFVYVGDENKLYRAA